MSFYLFGSPDEKLRLKSFSGTSKNGQCVIRIEITTNDAGAFGYALSELGEVEKGQRPVTAPPKPKRLALPAPSYREGEA